MKPNTILTVLVFLCSAAWLTSGCKKNQSARTRTYTYTLYSPIFLKRSEIVAGINGNPNEPINSAGKVYVKENYIFLNEIDKGIHVIDNSDPSHPFQTAFLKIPGNRDIAVKENILYADMYSELLAINIADIHHVAITSDLTNVFRDRGIGYNSGDTADVVTGVIAKDTTVTEPIYPVMIDNCSNCDAQAFTGSGTNKSSGGKAGSMARMVIMDADLYAIAEPHSLSVINVSQPASPQLVSTMGAGFDLETIFPFENKLFLGSAVGVFMFDVSDREHPSEVGMFTHGRACDPVIADGDYAYVTLHAGTSCGGDANELDVVNIKNLMNPSLVKSYSMTQPKGLSKDGHLLFVCDGGDAVKIFNASDPTKLNYITKMWCPDPYDIITGERTAMVVAKDGIYQYDYSNLEHIHLLSVVKTTIK